MCTRKQITTLFAFIALFYPTICKKQNRTIYVLLWTFTGKDWSYRNLDSDEGHVAFERRNCSFQNCYITTDRKYFKSVLDFDVLVFNAFDLCHGYPDAYMPIKRSERQLYVFFSVEPAAYSPIHDTFDGIFNVTWTYLLKSDVVHPYFFVKNNLGEIIAPRIDTHWLDLQNMPPIDPNITQKTQRKSIAAVWFASNCGPQKRLIFAHSLNDELSKYGHRVDIYGSCGNNTYCQKTLTDRSGFLTNCYSKIESDYYFVLAFENSFTEDYVTEKVLHGLLHFSVPIVYGGANYSRFLPDGIYLNALELGVQGLAKEMNDIINDPKRYYDFFKWHDYYSVHDTAADEYRESVCEFCAFLNNMTILNETQVYENITGWWNAPFSDEYPNTPKSWSTPSLFESE